MLKAEQTAYDWFAKQNDPHLVRVVQYTTLFQAFRAFKVESAAAPGSTDKDVVAVEQRAAVDALLAKVQQLTAEEIDPLVKRMDQCTESLSHRRRINDRLTRKQITGKEAERALQRFSADSYRRAITAIQKLPKEKQDQLAQALTGEHLLAALSIDQFVACQVLGCVESLDKELAKRLSDRSHGWMHSPVLIYDHNSGAMASMQGGHNWTTEIPQIRLDPQVLRGQVSPPDQDGFYRINPARSPGRQNPGAG